VIQQTNEQLRALLAGKSFENFADVRGAFGVGGHPLFESFRRFAAALNQSSTSLLRHDKQSNDYNLFRSITSFFAALRCWCFSAAALPPHLNIRFVSNLGFI
jgi:hypothetical protein